MNSSKETANTKIEPPIIEGKIIVKVTVLNTLIGFEPRFDIKTSIAKTLKLGSLLSIS